VNELIAAVKWNLNRIILVVVIIVALGLIALGWFIHGWINPPMQVKPTTDGEWHGVTVRPAIVAASKVPQGVIAQIQLTINLPATHEWAKERGSNGLSTRSNNGIFSGLVRGQDDTTEMDAKTPQGDSEGIGFKTYDFKSRGGGWFTTRGEIQFNAWSIPLIIQTLANGDMTVLTDEPDITFSVKQAVKVKPKAQLKWSVGYLYGTDGSHEITAGKDLFPWLSAKAAVEFGAGKVNGKVGGEVRW